MGQDPAENQFPVQWIVESVSSQQSDLHPGSNALESDLDKLWLTQTPTDHAWLCLEPRPPTAFTGVEVVNAGSALLEIHGLREDALTDDDYELLLSAQQVMSVKDLMSKSNRNQAFIYDIDGTRKLAAIAAQQRWRKIRVNCRQPFGTSELRACIGLAYINFTPCHCKSNSNNTTQFPNSKAKPAVKRKLPSWLSSSEPKAAEDLPAKKPRASPHREVVKSDVEEGSNGTDLADADQEGSLTLEHPESQALAGKAVTLQSRVGDSSETGEERASRRSSLKRGSPDAKETGGKETKKANVEKEISTRIVPLVPAKDASSKVPTIESGDNELDRDQTEKKRDGLPHRQGGDSVQGESSQRKLHLSKEGKGRASREENQSKDGPEREFSKLMEGVIFSISGIQNPERGQLRTKGLEMAHNIVQTGAQTAHSLCAHLLIPQNLSKFKQTVDPSFPSFKSMQDWILECHKKHELVDFERFSLNKGRPWRLPDTTEKELKRKKVNCGSVEEIRKWAREDLTLIMDWLLQQHAKPEPEELDFTAAQGILVCLEDAVKSLTEDQGLSSIIENWGFLPRAVKELAAIEEGYTRTSKSTLQEAERLKGIYDEVLNEFLASSKKSTNVINDQRKGRNEEDEDDDDATEVISDVDSQETVDYNSDDTTVLDSEAILECTQKLMERFS